MKISPVTVIKGPLYPIAATVAVLAASASDSPQKPQDVPGRVRIDMCAPKNGKEAKISKREPQRVVGKKRSMPRPQKPSSQLGKP